jgi:fatty acid desaturase
VFGFFVGFALLVAFGIYAGMVWWLPVVLFTIYFLFSVTFTRIRAEAGLPWASSRTSLHTPPSSKWGPRPLRHQLSDGTRVPALVRPRLPLQRDAAPA